MSNPIPIPPRPKAPARMSTEGDLLTPDVSGSSPYGTSPPDYDSTPRLSRNPSFSNSSSYQEDWEAFPPLDRLSMLDLLDNFALPQQLEKFQKGLSAQADKVRKSREALKTKGLVARERVVEEWRRHVPSADEQLERYRKRMRHSVKKLEEQWNDAKTVTMREKAAFIFGVMNIFISGYLLGGFPEYFQYWYTVQILYFMPIRFYTYHKRGYHYFLADLCYFVNFLLVLSLWIFPESKRLFMATYCLAFGNNAVAIIMWRNSLVFHSFDKVTSLFIHIMPCATLHCMVHLTSPEVQRIKYPAVYTILHSPPGSLPTNYASMVSMLIWSSLPYAIWQLSYYFFITVRRRDKIAAGRPTSFTWLRKSYSKAWIGRLVLSLPNALQEPAFMMIQYLYAVFTMLPCPLWFHYRLASGAFLMTVFVWSVYNGSTYYIDVFGKRFQKELEAMRAEVAKWQNTPEGGAVPGSPLLTPLPRPEGKGQLGEEDGGERKGKERSSVDDIPLLADEKDVRGGKATGIDVEGGARDVARERKAAVDIGFGN